MTVEPRSDVPSARSVKLASVTAFNLGPVRVDPATRSLSRDGLERSIEPRAMQVLVALAQAEELVLSRDVLIERCWDGRIVGDDAIYRVMSQLRSLALDIGADAFRIETIAKVGYRLVLEGAQQAPAPPPAIVAPPPPAQETPELKPVGAAPRWSRRAVASGIVAASAALLISRLESARTDPYHDLIAQSENAERMDLPDSNAKGVRFLQEAVALKPSNPLGWGKLALALTGAAEYATAQLTMDYVSRAQEAAHRALALDPRQPDARAALALLPPFFGDWREAERRMQQVLADHPQHLPTIDARDFLHSAVGRMREASHSRIAYGQLEPLHARFQYRLIYAHWNLGSISQADRVAERALQLWPMHPGVWFARLWTLAFTGRPERALAHLENEAGRPSMSDPFVQMLRRALLALTSRTPTDVALATEAMLAMLAGSASAAIHAIMTLSALGDLDRAFAVSEAYLLDRGPLIASVRWRSGEVSINDHRRRKTHMLFVPATAPMRGDSRFAQLTEQLGLAEYWRAASLVPDHLGGT